MFKSLIAAVAVIMTIGSASFAATEIPVSDLTEMQASILPEAQRAIDALEANLPTAQFGDIIEVAFLDDGNVNVRLDFSFYVYDTGNKVYAAHRGDLIIQLVDVGDRHIQFWARDYFGAAESR